MTLPAPPAGRARFIGVDLARFLAIAGMMAAHLVTIVEWDPAITPSAQAAADVANALTEGIAAPLFAVLGGVSSVFATRSLLRDRRPGGAIAAVAVRGALLLLLGLLLGQIENPVVVVLAYYGTAMILVAPLIAARGWVIGVVIAALTAAGGAVNAAVRLGLRVADYEGRAVSFDTFSMDAGEAVRALLITGIYPAITWAAYLLIGVLVGRLLVAARRRRRLARDASLLAVGGAVLAALAHAASAAVLAALPARLLGDPVGALGALGSLGSLGADPSSDGRLSAEAAERLMESAHGAPPSAELWAQLLAIPHSGSPMDILRTAGIACAVIGLLVLLCDRDAPPPGLRAPRSPGGAGARLLEPVRAAGAAPLTIYTLHVLVTGWLLGPLMTDPTAFADGFPWWVAGTGAFALHLAGALAIGALLAALGKRGPLEALLSGTVRLVVRP
ncbi:heparan-alpha-glucosaminide N-acetyltransferase domain-containing protein [Leucobacter allii]|uniref:heparan-alpha-glucosaminide N-acetyltransferase domain-containing protein n=1 Tax=Leucobacter allii TaxID=2932247 RepID=UPI001FD4722B|nr:heparan-alpha-glucosaminide N-acetyltransferase domain-containing protein [Leucobacter allii]UOR01040.1 heparan-alpha-glucosaminide N-acetyltransferase domain-containing protein [Leucobacter allii]